MHYPLVVISDLHFGTDNRSADLLAEFLNHVSCDRLILNGDIFDGLHMKNQPNNILPEMQKRALDALHAKIAMGTEVIYIPGNHDAELRHMKLAGKKIFGMAFQQEMDIIHNGKRFLITHGDRLGDKTANNFGKIPRILSFAYRHGYAAFSHFSSTLDRVAGKFLKRHFSIAARARKRIEKMTGVIDTPRQQLIANAKQRGYSGVICGHFHSCAIKQEKDGFLYLNSGDWVDSFTALTLDDKGKWEILNWTDARLALGLKRHMSPEKEENPHLGFRLLTEKMLLEAQKIWPGKSSNGPAPG